MLEQIPWTPLYGQVKVSDAVPKGTVWLISQRKPNETVEEWAKRCAVIYNVGEKSNVS